MPCRRRTVVCVCSRAPHAALLVRPLRRVVEGAEEDHGAREGGHKVVGGQAQRQGQQAEEAEGCRLGSRLVRLCRRSVAGHQLLARPLVGAVQRQRRLGAARVDVPPKVEALRVSRDGRGGDGLRPRSSRERAQTSPAAHRPAAPRACPLARCAPGPASPPPWASSPGRPRWPQSPPWRPPAAQRRRAGRQTRRRPSLRAHRGRRGSRSRGRCRPYAAPPPPPPRAPPG